MQHLVFLPATGDFEPYGFHSILRNNILFLTFYHFILLLLPV